MAKIQEKTEKLQIRLYRSDIAVIQEYHPNVGYNQVIRTLVRRYARRLQERGNEILSEQELELGNDE